MPSGGHNKKSGDLHWLQGTKPVVASVEGAAVEPGRPAYPKAISPEAKRVFKRLCGLLEQRRHLSHGDGELLRVYSILFTRHEKALAKLATEGEIRVYVRLDSNGQPHDVEKPNHWLKIAETCERNMVACLDRLGLSVIARSKVKPTGDDATKPALTAEEQFFADVDAKNKERRAMQ